MNGWSSRFEEKIELRKKLFMKVLQSLHTFDSLNFLLSGKI